MRVRAAFLILIILLPSAKVEAASTGPLDPGQAHTDTLSSAVQSHLSLFRPSPDSAEVAKLIEAAAAANDTSAELAVAIAALWRRAGHYDLALSWLGRLTARISSRSSVSLERARTLLARAARDGNPNDRQAGEEAFWEACAAADSATAAEFWLDLRGLATRTEQEQWPELAGSEETCPWIHDFVEERAWRSGLSTGERLVLHYGRLVYARHWYGLRKPRFVQSRADFRGRPPGLELDDRGLIYLRMGEPERVEYGTVGDDEPGIAEHWAYPRPDGYWLYYFTPGRGDYFLVENLGPQAKPGNDFFQRYVTNSAVDPLPLKRMVFLDRADPFDAAERRALRRAEQLIAREFQRRAITENPEAPEMLLRLNLLVETLRFWNPHTDRASVWLLASARAADLEGRQRSDGIWIYNLEANGSFLTLDSVESFKIERHLELEEPLPDDAGVELRHVLDLGPGHYPLTLAVLDRNRQTAEGNWYRDTVVVPDYTSELPVVSDLAIAADSGGTWTRDGETFLRATPSHTPGADGILHLYFEVYGLGPGTEYEVNVRLLGEDVEELTPGDQASGPVFRLSYRAAMPVGQHPIGTHHTRIDLRNTPDGRYQLSIQVQDLASSITSLPSTTWVHHERNGDT